MYIESIHIERLKRIHDLKLNFVEDGGEIRKWTVLIGPNGCGKSSILQAIALSAAGQLKVNVLAAPILASLYDRREISPLTADSSCDSQLGGTGTGAPLRIEARFAFGPIGTKYGRHYPGKPPAAPTPSRLISKLEMRTGGTTLRGEAHYDGAANPDEDPLVEARDRQRLPHWFVAAYGPHRFLPHPATSDPLTDPQLDRMRPLFGAIGLKATDFAEDFEASKSRMYNRVLKRVLLKEGALLPRIADIELRGRGGVSTASDLIEKQRFVEQIGDSSLQLPAAWLSHGYQASLAWLSDLVGQIILEADGEVGAEEMEGLVLIDEIDLFLHPTWQINLIPALKATFPALQFVVATHSPLVVAGLAPDEIVRLEVDDAGNVVRGDDPPDPRLMTGSEIYERYFGVDHAHPDELGRRWRDYSYLARDPERTDQEDQRVQAHLRYFREHKFDPGQLPAARINP